MDFSLAERIRERAYHIWLSNGRQSDAVQNWLDAEREILTTSLPELASNAAHKKSASQSSRRRAKRSSS